MNIIGLKFDVGILDQTVLLAVGDSDGYLSIYSVWSGCLVQKRHLGFRDIAVL